MRISDYHLHCLRRFFQGVGSKVAEVLGSPQSIGEPDCTALLMVLLRDDSPLAGALDYSAAVLAQDLGKSGGAAAVSVRFSAHCHNQNFEGSTSYADFGVVVEHDFQNHKSVRAMLVQAKRLYRSETFSVASRFEHLGREQLENFQRLVGSTRSGLYLLYSPMREAFDAASRSAIDRGERDLLGAGRKPAPDRPGLSFCAPELLLQGRRQPSLADLYSLAALRSGSRFGPGCLLERFDQVMADGLMSGAVGTEDQDIVDIAKGLPPGGGGGGPVVPFTLYVHVAEAYADAGAEPGGDENEEVDAVADADSRVEEGEDEGEAGGTAMEAGA